MMIINKELEEFAERNITPKPHIETCQVDLSVQRQQSYFSCGAVLSDRRQCMDLNTYCCIPSYNRRNSKSPARCLHAAVSKKNNLRQRINCILDQRKPRLHR